MTPLLAISKILKEVLLIIDMQSNRADKKGKKGVTKVAKVTRIIKINQIYARKERLIGGMSSISQIINNGYKCQSLKELNNKRQVNQIYHKFIPNLNLENISNLIMKTIDYMVSSTTRNEVLIEIEANSIINITGETLILNHQQIIIIKT